MTDDTNDSVRSDVRDRLAAVRKRIADACEKAGRRESSVTLVAVTKYATPEQVAAVVAEGVTDLGENYAQNLAGRAGDFGEAVRWHMVGHLQRNKVKQVVPHVAMIQTLDSLRLAEELDAQVPRLLGQGSRLPVLMQVNCSGEGQKSGVAVGAAKHLGEQIGTMPGLRLMGLMTMAKHGDDEAGARRTYARCREIFEEMKALPLGEEFARDFRHLSMGMSDDLDAGIAEGATVVRVGGAIFGERDEGRDEG